jgi:membrane protein
VNDEGVRQEQRLRPAGYVSAGRQFVRQAMRDDVMGLSAELAYRFFLALFPFAIFLAAMGSFVAAQLPVENPAERAVELLGEALPEEAAAVVQAELESLIQNQTPGLLSIGAILALFFATGGTNAIIKALDRVYSVRDTRPPWKRYLVALALTVIAGTAVVTAFLLIVPLRILGPGLAEALGIGENTQLLINLLGGALAFALVVVAVAYVFRVAPNIRLPLRSVLPGAFVFAVAWVGATVGFFVWVTNFGDYATTYGALAGAVIVMIWFYVSALLLLLAAELNEVLHEMADPSDVENRRRAAEEHDVESGSRSAQQRRQARLDDDTEEGASAA